MQKRSETPNTPDGETAPELAPTYDQESRLQQAHQEQHQDLRLWLRMLSCTTRIESLVRSRLRNEFDVTLPRFDLMAQLERHPEGLRMGELSRRMMVSGGNVTGITDQLEQEKLVVRVSDQKDRRAYSVKLTPAGRRAFKRMAEAHEAWISDMFAGLQQEQKAELFEVLSQIKSRANALGATDEQE
jgi:DNA-binding MarR family transcriptional regulator